MTLVRLFVKLTGDNLTRDGGMAPHRAHNPGVLVRVQVPQPDYAKPACRQTGLRLASQPPLRCGWQASLRQGVLAATLRTGVSPVPGETWCLSGDKILI